MNKEKVNQNEEQSRVDKLKSRLYRPDKKVKKKKSFDIKPKKYSVKDDWERAPVEEKGELKEQEQFMQRKKKAKKKVKQNKKTSIFKILMIFSVLFFIASFGIAFFVFYRGVNVVSTENVDLSITGPTIVGGGENLSFQVTVQNNNSVDLKLADLIVDFPKGTLSADGSFREITQMREELGVVPAGGVVTKNFKAILFGGEGDKKSLTVTIEYRAEDSNALFYKDRQYALVIDSSPVGFVVDMPKEVMSGQEFALSIDVVSNSVKDIKDFLLTVDYPFGFEFLDSNLDPVYKNNVWNLGTIKPDSKQTLTINGILVGQDKEERVFNFNGGLEDKEDESALRAVLVSASEPISIKKTLFGLDLALDGGYASEYVFPVEETIRGDVLWANDLPLRLADVKVVAKLSGAVLDEKTISVQDGYYNSSENTITWDKDYLSDLEVLAPNSDGSLSFSFSPYALTAVSNLGITNPEINIDIVATGNKLANDTVEKVSTTLSKKIKIDTNLILTKRSLYSVGAFVNSGPIPPKVDKKTTYTVVWTVTNTSNDVNNAKVTASLPAYVTWLGVVSPQSEDLTYNPVGGEIVWNIGDVKAREGISSSPKQVSFQVSLLPSLSQLNAKPSLVKNIVLTGEDDFTGTLINSSYRDITTRISTDPMYSLSNIKVVQ